MTRKQADKSKEKTRSITFRLSEDLYQRFSRVCEENAINQSAWLRKQIEKLVTNFGFEEEHK